MSLDQNIRNSLSSILIRETSKNFICRCPKCGDHTNPRKRGHLYVSRDINTPTVHCFLCNFSTHLSKFIEFLTGEKKLSLEISKETPETKTKNHSIIKKENLKIPEKEGFEHKRAYIRKRCGSKINPEDLDNLIFDIVGFAKCNNITSLLNENSTILDLFQRKFIGFLSKNQTMLFMRNIDNRDKFKFKKHEIQPGGLFLDYVSFNGGNIRTKKVVMAEGTFDILGEMAADSTGLFNKTCMYVAPQSFSYSSCLKSLAYFENLFRIDLTILSDSDKKVYNYYKIINQNRHILNSIEIYYNLNGNDFNCFPIKPARYSLDVVSNRMNKSKNKIYKKGYKKNEKFKKKS